MSSLTKFKFDRNTVREDGLVNITALAKSYCTGWLPETIGRAPSKDFTKNWLLTDEAQRLVQRLAEVLNVCATDLVKVVRGGNAGGTWIHLGLVEYFKDWLCKDQSKIELQGVYLITCTESGVFKIGVSQNVAQRLKTVQTSYPFELKCLKFCLPLVGSARDYEKQFHKSLDRYRLNGEWFSSAGFDSALELFSTINIPKDL